MTQIQVVDEVGKNKEIVGVLPVNVFLVSFVDGEGKKGTRLAFQPQDSDTVFNLQEKIAGKFVATAASGWFRDEFNRMREESEEVESI